MRKREMSGVSLESLLVDESVEVLKVVTEDVEEVAIPLSRYDFAKAYRRSLGLQGVYTEEDISIKVAKRVKALSTTVKDTSLNTVRVVETYEQKLSHFQINSK